VRKLLTSLVAFVTAVLKHLQAGAADGVTLAGGRMLRSLAKARPGGSRGSHHGRAAEAHLLE